MANKDAKVSGNVDGPYYVDDQCIGCNACITEAPDNFKMDDNAGLALVVKQPVNEEEVKKCENAMSACPVEAIGNDG